jgi:hypothetical protein
VIFFTLLALGLIAAVLVAAALSLFVGRHGESDGPRPGWVRTDEVFRDPGTDRVMRVWADGNGGRHYLPESAGGVSPA